MRFTVLTLFPRMLRAFSKESLIGKAVAAKKIKIKIVDFRKYAADKRMTVDDYQIGGGPGMVLMAEPIALAIEKNKTSHSRVILLTPQGKLLSHQTAQRLARANQDLILVCGHYEGFDERIADLIDEEISIGDYVTMGGEVAAAVVIEAVARLRPGVIKNEHSLAEESHAGHLLDYALYTKPNVWRDKPVPPVLLTGHHKNIAAYRTAERVARTKKKRPDIYKKYLQAKRSSNEKT